MAASQNLSGCHETPDPGDEIADGFTEVLAYGTAVRVEPVR